MAGATELGRMRMSIAENEDFKAAFMELMWNVLAIFAGSRERENARPINDAG